MADLRLLGVIPARLGSTRLPRKPLQVIAGRPLIEWVWSRVRGFGLFETLVVATDSEEVAAVCREFGAAVELTSADHPSGTDRVAEVATRPHFQGYDVIVSIQGDEPFVTVEQLRRSATLVANGWDIGTVASHITSLADWRDPAVVKVVRRSDGGAMYFTRAPVPFSRDAEPTVEMLATGPFLRHIGVYAYSPAALARWVALPVGELERLERLEQLRPLCAGLTIGVDIVDAAGPGIDTPEDVARAEALLAANTNPMN